MTKGVPFISTNVGNARILPGGITIDDISEMHTYIDRLLADKNAYDSLSAAGKTFVNENCRYLKKKFPKETFYGFYPSRGLKAHNGLEINKWFDVSLPENSRFSDLVAKTLYWTAKVFFRFNIQPPFTDNDWHRKPSAILYLGFWQNKKYVQSVIILIQRFSIFMVT